MKRGYWTEPMTFVGDHGVEVSARAFILRPLLSPDFRVQEIAFEGGTFNVGDEQREEAERIKKYIRSFVGEPLSVWDSASFVSAKAFRPPHIPAKKHSSGGFTGTGDPSMIARPDLPGERRVEPGFAGSSYGVPVVFEGNEDVSVSAVAHSIGGIVDDVLVVHVVPEPGSLSFSQDVERRRLTEMAKALIGKPRSAWAFLGSFVDAKTIKLNDKFEPHRASMSNLKIEKIDLPGCTTREQAEALVRDFRRRHPVLAEAWDGAVTDSTSAEAERRTPSNTLNRVIEEFRKREEFGLGKYGTTVDRTDLSRKQWLQHAKEEAMDSVLYFDRLIQIEDEIELKKSVKLTVDDPASDELRDCRRQMARNEYWDLTEWFRQHPCKLTLYTRGHKTATTLDEMWAEAFGRSSDVRVPHPPFPGPGTPVADSFFHTRLSA